MKMENTLAFLMKFMGSKFKEFREASPEQLAKIKAGAESLKKILKKAKL